jgi:hypothetical protein
MNLSQFTIGQASLDENKIYLGKLDKRGRTWLHKKDVTNEFLHLMISYIGENKMMPVVSNGVTKYEITCKKIKC